VLAAILDFKKQCYSICLKFEASVPQLKITRKYKKDSWILCECVKDGTTPAVEASLQVSTVRSAETVYV